MTAKNPQGGGQLSTRLHSNNLHDILQKIHNLSNRKKKLYYVNQCILESQYPLKVKAATDSLTRYDLWPEATLITLGVKMCEQANEIIFCQQITEED